MKKFLLLSVMALATLFAQAQIWQSNVKLCNNYISSENFNDLAGLAGVEAGSITYDHALSTLTLEGVKWTRPKSGTYYFIKVEETSSPVKVIFKGINEIDNSEMQRAVIFISENSDVTIEGESPEQSILQIKGGNGILMADQSYMYIKNMSITITDPIYPLNAYANTDLVNLTINNSNITTHPKYEMLKGLKSFELIDCKFETPMNAVYDEAQHAVLSEGALLKDIDVKIVTTATDIKNVGADKKAQKVIENGVLYIIRNGKRFDITGAEVK